MSSNIKWDKEGNLGWVARQGPYTLYIVEMAVVSMDIEVIWGVCETDSYFLTSKGFGVDRPESLVTGKETLSHSAVLLGVKSEDAGNSLIATCMQKAEEAFRKIDATRLAEEVLLKDE